MLSQYIVILNLNWKNKMSSELLFSLKNVSSSLALESNQEPAVVRHPDVQIPGSCPRWRLRTVSLILRTQCRRELSSAWAVNWIPGQPRIDIMILSQTQAHNKQISQKIITTKLRKKGKGGKWERNQPDALKSHSLVLEEAFWSGIKTNNDCTHEYIKKSLVSWWQLKTNSRVTIWRLLGHHSSFTPITQKIKN